MNETRHLEARVRQLSALIAKSTTKPAKLIAEYEFAMNQLGAARMAEEKK